MKANDRTSQNHHHPTGDPNQGDAEPGEPHKRPEGQRRDGLRDPLRDSAEHQVLKNIARTYARYIGPLD